MKKLFILIACSSLLIFASCIEDDSIEENNKIGSACSVKDPGNNLPWLKEIITKAEEDRINRTYKGNYSGHIYLETYKGQDLFFIDMMMGSGGLYGYVFHCDGSKAEFGNSEDMLNFHRSMKKDRIIYSTIR